MEYAVWAIRFDLRGAARGGATDCDGDLSHDPVGMCLVLDQRIPCTDPQRGPVLTLLDGNLALDYPAFASNHSVLEWWSECYCPLTDHSPPCQSPVSPNSWGRLRRLYR